MEPINIQYSLSIQDSEQLAAPNLVVDASHLDAFQQSMQGQNPQQQADAIASIGGVDNAKGTLGDKILEGLQNVKSGYDNQVGAVEESLKTTDPLSVNDMMQLQLDLAKLTLQGELINKTVSKSTQNLDTLLKSQ